MKVNLNTFVCINLTEKGKQILKDHPHQEVIPPPDADGTYRMLLHQVMYIFGRFCFNGGDVPFEDNAIVFTEKP